MRKLALQNGMSFRKALITIAGVWLVVITLLHASLNLHLFRSKPVTTAGQTRFRIGFLPVTCHLTCPVTDFINKQLSGASIFEPVRFNGWPELKEAYLSGYTPATFILAPMAMALREQGVPIKIVYLGHRDGSAVMVHKDSHIYRMEDLRGKRIAVPNRFSNQRLLIFRALKQAHMTVKDIELVEMPPPDMPAAPPTPSAEIHTPAPCRSVARTPSPIRNSTPHPPSSRPGHAPEFSGLRSNSFSACKRSPDSAAPLDAPD